MQEFKEHLKQTPIANNFVSFNGSIPPWTTHVDGERFSVTAFYHQAADGLSQKDK